MGFKVGDKVRAITERYVYTVVSNGWEGIVENVDGNLFDATTTHRNDGGNLNTFRNLEVSDFELVEPKKTKNQRITALEKKVEEMDANSFGDYEAIEELRKEVAELKIIVEDLRERKVIDTTAQVEEEVVTDFPTEPKSANQQRAEIIEKAKKFVEENTKYNGETFSGKKGVKVNPCYIGIPSFKTNEKKRAVTVLFYCVGSGRLLSKGITKCNPSDVYNEHIGKAIALGRALGLDVSEFEQAVQPSEVVVGHTVETFNLIQGVIKHHRTFEVENVEVNGDVIKMYRNASGVEYTTFDKHLGDRIINDTNAIYGEVK